MGKQYKSSSHGPSHAFSDWAEVSLILVAVLKAEAATAHVLLLSFVATNYFLWLGLARIYGNKHQHNYATVMASIHMRALFWVLTLAIIPSALPTSVDDGRFAKSSSSHANTSAATSAIVAAVMSLLVLFLYTADICLKHSPIPAEIDSCIERGKNGLETDNLVLNGRDTRVDWKPTRLHPSEGVSIVGAILVAASVMYGFLSVLLLDSVVFVDEQHSTLVFVKILITALLSALTGLAASYLHAWRFGTCVDPVQEAKCAVVALIMRLLLVARPICVIVEWTAYGSLLVVDPMTVALFLAAYLSQNTGQNLHVAQTLFRGQH